MKNKFKNFAWVIIVSLSSFILISAVWIRKTYGRLSDAMANESFANYFENNRSLFLLQVILPTIVILIMLFILQLLFENKNFFKHKKLLISMSLLLLIFSCCAAQIGLDISAYFARQSRLSGEQWYDTDKLIVHAFGEIDGVTYSNSKEAMENSYNNGKHLLECDLIMTSDNQVVACHDWDDWNSWSNDSGQFDDIAAIPTYDEFMNTKIMGKYTAVGGIGLILFMKEHPDVYIITDTKDADPKILGEPFKALVELALANDCEEVLERFVIQIYHGYMYEMIKDIYPFSNYIFTLYQEGFRGDVDKLEEYASFCACNNIDVITLNAQYYNDELLNVCNRYNIQIFVHTVNDESEIKTFLEKEVGVYTDVTDLSI